MAAAVTLAAFMAAVSVVARVDQPQARPVTALGLALLVVCGLALALGRALPLLAFTLAVGAAVGYLGLRFAGWPVYLGAFAGLVALVSGVARARLWVPLATLGGVGMALATGPPEGWQAVRMTTVGLVWAVVAVLAARGAQVRRRLAEEEAASRVVAERLRIARELHDVLSHSLASISLQAGIGLHLVDRQPQQARQALRTIRQASVDALAQARAALAVVRGTGGDPAAAPGLADLGALVASVRASGLRVELDADLDGRPVPELIGAIAYRVVQEALTNVMRHGGPGAHARARVGRVHDWLQIDVTDDGAGAAAAPARGPGHGLRGMAERVSAVGGELRAGPAPGGGFGLHARLPLRSTR
ncbi:MAG TPA: histidine kinase [Actinomycetes bacterium]|nr:histidine kinase [Actinomycetes bacterium]